MAPTGPPRPASARLEVGRAGPAPVRHRRRRRVTRGRALIPLPLAPAAPSARMSSTSPATPKRDQLNPLDFFAVPGARREFDGERLAALSGKGHDTAKEPPGLT